MAIDGLVRHGEHSAMDHAEASAHVALESGVVLLAAALLFVLLFRKLGLGATLGYLVAVRSSARRCSAWWGAASKR